MLNVSFMSTLLHEAKTLYTVTNKTTGEVLGYAFMTVNGQLTPDQVKIIPWYTQEDVPDDPTSNHSCDTSHEKLDHDHEDIGCITDLAAIEGCDGETKEEIKRGDWSGAWVDPTSLSSANHDHEDIECITDMAGIEGCDNETKEEIKRGDRSGAWENVVSLIGAKVGGEVKNVVEKKNSDQVLVPSKKVSYEKPGKKMGNYKEFYTEVSESQPTNRKLRKVRCRLCPESRTLSMGNFGEHYKAYHKPPVECSSCQRKFSAIRINIHKQNCVP